MTDLHPGNGNFEVLRRYWTHGPGAAKWVGSPTPFRTLRAHLAKYVHNPHELDGLTANLYHEVFGHWPGKHQGAPATSAEKLAKSVRGR